MERLFHLLPKALNKRGLQEHAQSALLIHRTQQWLEKRFPVTAPNIHTRHIKDGVLTVACDHAIALQECQASLGDLMENLKTECPFVRIREVRFVRS